MAGLFGRTTKEISTSAPIVTPEERATQFQSAFPTAETMLRQNIAKLEKTKHPVKRVSPRSRLVYPLYGVPGFGQIISGVRTAKSFLEVVEGTEATVHNMSITVDQLLEHETYNAAQFIFDESQKKGSPFASTAQKVVESSVHAWKNAEVYKIQHPEDKNGHRKVHSSALGIFEAAVTELGIFEAIDTRIKNHFDINMPEIAKFLALGFTTEEIFSQFKKHLPEFNSYLAALQNAAHKDAMTPLFREIAEVKPLPQPVSTPTRRRKK